MWVWGGGAESAPGGVEGEVEGGQGVALVSRYGGGDGLVEGVGDGDGASVWVIREGKGGEDVADGDGSQHAIGLVEGGEDEEEGRLNG